MEIANVVGRPIMLSSASGRNYIGTIAYLNSQNLTVTLANAWSDLEFYDIIIIKATDILYYEFLQDNQDFSQSPKANEKVLKPQRTQKNFRKKNKYVPKKISSN